MKRIIWVLLITVLLISALGMTSCEMPGSTTTKEPAHVHAYTDTVVAPTCVDEGYTVHKCAECGYEMHNAFVPADGRSHKIQVVERVESTCTQDGYENTNCIYCENVPDTNVLKAAHDFGDWVISTAPTCTTAGEERRYCSVCTSYESNVLDAAHDYDERLDVVVEPTCTTDGYTRHTCYICGHYYDSQFINAYGHEWKTDLDEVDGDGWVLLFEGNCTTRTQEMRQCEVCEFVDTRHTDFVHDLEEAVTAPSCTAPGYTTTHCKLCDFAQVSDYVAPEHTYGNWETVIAYTCKQQGVERRDCELCDVFEERRTEPAHNYTDSVQVFEASKYQSGYTKHNCACGLSYIDGYVPYTGSEGLEYKIHTIFNSETNRYEDYYEVVGIGTCTDTEIAIPFEYNGIPVKVIGYEAFFDNDNITTVYLSMNITDIGIAAFWNCDNLTKFVFDGYKAEWELINMGESWNTGLKTHEVVCIDYTYRNIVQIEEDDELTDEEK